MLFNESKVKKIIEEFNKQLSFKGNTKDLLPKFSKEEIIDGIGSIAVIYDGDIELTKKLAILSVRTHNQIYLITDNNIDENKKIIQTLNSIMKENDYSSNSVELLNITHSTFLSMQKNFEYALIIGTKKDYTSLLPHLLIKSIFYQANEYNIFIDNNLNDNQKETLKEIDEYAFENDQLINYIDISTIDTQKEEIDQTIHSINLNGKNQTISIFTTVQEHSYYFINSLHCNNIFINAKPFADIEFDENDFICKKHILFV